MRVKTQGGRGGGGGYDYVAPPLIHASGCTTNIINLVELVEWKHVFLSKNVMKAGYALLPHMEKRAYSKFETEETLSWEKLLDSLLL